MFNLGFDGKGPSGVHWIYVPGREVCFYRVGFYDNIWPAERMSLYVEVGCRADADLELEAIAAMRERVLADLVITGIVDGQHLVDSHHVVLDPAYVHVTQASADDVIQQKAGAGRAWRVHHRPLWLVDILLHRGQHRRSQTSGRSLQPLVMNW